MDAPAALAKLHAFSLYDSFERTLPDFRGQWLIENCNDNVVKYTEKQDFVEF
jgi:hypothetical protein